MTTPYTPNEVIVDTSSGTVSSSITLLCSGTYELHLVGGGGGNSFTYARNPNQQMIYIASTGGSGSAFVGKIHLDEGIYTITLGAGGGAGTGNSGGDSSFGTSVAYGGYGGTFSGYTPVAGSGGASPNITYSQTETPQILSAGNNGTSYPQSPTPPSIPDTASVYDPTSSIGAGGGILGGTTVSGYEGLVKLIFIEADATPDDPLDPDEPEEETVLIPLPCGLVGTKETKYYKNSTTPNVTLVGSPTVSNGVISNFSASNYAKIPVIFNPQSNTWEMIFKFTTGNNVSSGQVILGDIERTADNLAIWIYSSKFNLVISTNTVGTYTVLANTTYYIKVVYNRTSYMLSYSLDGETFTTDITVTTATIPATNFAVGIDYDNNYLLGTIDLKESCIKVNNEIWWTGMQLVESTSSDYIYTKQIITYSAIANSGTLTAMTYQPNLNLKLIN